MLGQARLHVPYRNSMVTTVCATAWADAVLLWWPMQGSRWAVE